MVSFLEDSAAICINAFNMDNNDSATMITLTQIMRMSIIAW